MFDQQTSQPLPPQPPTPPQAQPPVVEDMFARNDAPQSSAASQGMGPMGNNAFRPAAMPPVNEQELFGGRSFSWGRVVVVIFSLILLVAIGVGAWFGFQYIMKQRATSTPSPVTDENKAPVASSTPATQESVDSTPTEPSPAVDTDSDGLSDTEEAQLGTNPERADSDIDGLIDRAEIQVYKTDPLKADTDGDGYIDGDEVINGFDPLIPGSARLIQVPQN